MSCSKGSSKRKVYRDTNLPQETEKKNLKSKMKQKKSQINNLTLYQKELEKE